MPRNRAEYPAHAKPILHPPGTEITGEPRSWHRQPAHAQHPRNGVVAPFDPFLVLFFYSSGWTCRVNPRYVVGKLNLVAFVVLAEAFVSAPPGITRSLEGMVVG